MVLDELLLRVFVRYLAYGICELEVLFMAMDVRLLRIDSRLLHGQVATNWVKAAKVDRILVVSDGVAKDELRKVLIRQATPPGTKVNVIPINKMLRVYQDVRFAGLKVVVLVECPLDAQRLIESGIRINSINIGSLSFSMGRRMVTDTIAVNQTDVEAFTWLHNRGIQLETRKVSTDSKRDLWKALREHGLVKKTV